MKATVIGVKRMHGVGKDSGNAYDMPRALLLVPVQPGKMGGATVEGYGFEISEIPVDWALAERFSKLSWPQKLDLELDAQPRFGKFESVVVDFKELSAQPQVKAA